VTIPYADVATKKKVADGWADFFTNPYVAQCGPITTCTLHAKGCTVAILQSINSVTGVLMDQNIKAGYTTEYCVKCQNVDGGTIT